MTSKEDSLSSHRPAKPARVLACVLCQQRKVKCNREFPCANCIKARVQCVPATQLARRKRRRLPGHDLLGRLRHYEELLNKNNIPFEAIGEHGANQALEDTGDDGVGSTVGMSPTMQDPESQKNEAVFETKYALCCDFDVDIADIYIRSFWDALNQRVQSSLLTPLDSTNNAIQSVNPKDSNEAGDLEVEDHPSFDQMPESVVTKAWEHVCERDDLLLFGARRTDADLSTMHPSHAHIFKLWQIYLDNVNPLLKVTHVPTLQAQVIDVVGHLNSIEPNLEALMFGVYCIAVMSVDDQECATLLGSTKKELLGIYQTACQQALLKCNFLRSTSRDCLTALFFYIVSLAQLLKEGVLTVTRFLSGPIHIHSLYLQSLLSPSALHNECLSPASQRTPSMDISKARCVDGYGGLLF
jgi:DNA-binding XRE family transcriptional regulator